MKLLLFDIDLTLVNTGGSGRSAMTLAFEKLFGMKNGLERVNFAGRTDALIFKDALRHQGLQWTPKKEDKFKKVYFEYLKSEIKKPNARKHIEPGISALLDLLGHQPDITLGLLTGNWRRGGRIKLEYFKLFHYFQ
ncbi:MAG: HAD family hydrolase, partial [bacterium]